MRKPIRQSVSWSVLALLPALVLPGCVDGGAGGFTELQGSWNGSYLLNGTLPLGHGNALDTGTKPEPQSHPASGTFIVTFTQDNPNEVRGTITATPDLCWNTANFSGGIQGTFFNNRLVFSYITSNVPGITAEVVFTVPVLNDPVLGTYDGNACGSGWDGGIRMERP